MVMIWSLLAPICRGGSRLRVSRMVNGQNCWGPKSRPRGEISEREEDESSFNVHRGFGRHYAEYSGVSMLRVCE